MISMRVSQIRIEKAEVMRRTELGCVKPLTKCAILVENEAKRSMKKGGRPAKARGPRGGRAGGTPSAPGTPPHVQKGNLRASITHAMVNLLLAIVGPTREAWYGKVHEFGGRHHPKRAFMRPALKKEKPKFPAQFRNCVK